MRTWAEGVTFFTDEIVLHESVPVKCLIDHVATASNEPDAVPDAEWQGIWQVVDANTMWGTWLFNRMPSWVLDLDANLGDPLRRYFRILGRMLNLTQADVDAFLSLWDIDLMPDAYLPNLANTLGLELPNEFDAAAKRRFILFAVEVYRRKGTKHSLEFLAKRFLGITLEITEDWQHHKYEVFYDDSLYTLPEAVTIRQVLERLLVLYEPAGLIHDVASTQIPYPNNILNRFGFLNETFVLNV